MIKKILICLTLLISIAHSQSSFRWTPVLSQSGTYFSSDRVTLAGLGFAAGVQGVYAQNIVAQMDAGLLWINGNAIATRWALGYQKQGWWSPALFATFALYWGERTEVLAENGQRPATPVWTAGLRLAPLRFAYGRGFASALEFGYGIGPDLGRCFELTVLCAGVRW
jgi:hypothetical protein